MEQAVWFERQDRVAALAIPQGGFALTDLSEDCCPLPLATCGGAQTDTRTEGSVANEIFLSPKIKHRLAAAGNTRSEYRHLY